MKETQELKAAQEIVRGAAIVFLMLGIAMCVARFYSKQPSQHDFLTTSDVLTAGSVLFFVTALCIFCMDLIRKTYCCEECGSWASTSQIVRELEWGTNVGGILLMDPFYIRRRNRICDDCNYIMSSHFDGTEQVPLDSA